MERKTRVSNCRRQGGSKWLWMLRGDGGALELALCLDHSTVLTQLESQE